MTMHVSVDESRCIGAGQCALTAPEIFEQRDEDGLSSILRTPPPPEFEDSVAEAAQLCPTMAIRLSG